MADADFFADLLPKQPQPQNGGGALPGFDDDVLVGPRSTGSSEASQSFKPPGAAPVAGLPMVSPLAPVDPRSRWRERVARGRSLLPLLPCSARILRRSWRRPCSRCFRSSVAACRRSWRTSTGMQLGRAAVSPPNPSWRPSPHAACALDGSPPLSSQQQHVLPCYVHGLAFLRSLPLQAA